MKVALYFTEGRKQVVLTPESAFERGVLKELGECELTVHKGCGFYSCNGGWDRQNDSHDSLIIGYFA